MPDRIRLPDAIMHETGRLDPEALTFVATIARRTGVPPETCREVQEKLAEGLAETRIWLSGPNEVPGFRRLAFSGLGRNTGMILAIGDDGLFSSSVINCSGISDMPIGQVIEREFSGDGIQRLDYSASFGIDPRTHAGKSLGNELLLHRYSHARQSVSTQLSPDLARFFAMLRGTLKARADRNGGGLAKIFRQEMDRDLLRQAWGTRMNDGSGLEWLSGSLRNQGIRDPRDPDDGAASLRRSTYRRQALRVFPAFTGVLSTVDATALIDAGQSVSAILADRVGIDPSRLAPLKGRGFRAIGSPGDLACLRDLDCVDLGSAPRRGRDWKTFWDTAATLRATFLSDPVTLEACHYMSDMEGRYTETLTRHAARITEFPERFPEIADGHVHDMFDSLTRKLVVPALALSGQVDHQDLGVLKGIRSVRTMVAAEAFLTMSLKDMEQASQRWHRNLGRIEDRLVGELACLKTPEWRPLVGNDRIDGMEVTEITSDQDLSRRGRSEGHCVGGYGPRVRAAARSESFSLIFSIDKGQVRRATAQVAVILKDGEVDKADLVEIRAARNAEPDAASRDVGVELARRVSRMAPERVALYRERMRSTESRRSEVMHSMTPLERTCGVDFTRPGYLEAAWRELSACLPRRLRKAGQDALTSTFLPRVQDHARHLTRHVDVMANLEPETRARNDHEKTPIEEEIPF